MSRRGNCYDNALMESWFSTVKHKLGEHFDSCGDAKMALFDYIEVFYNQRRRHSTLGQISPAEFERRMMTSAAQRNRLRNRSRPKTYYRWRKEYGGLRLDQAKRLKELERETTRLKKLVADQALDNSLLNEVAPGNF